MLFDEHLRWNSIKRHMHSVQFIFLRWNGITKRKQSGHFIKKKKLNFWMKFTTPKEIYTPLLVKYIKIISIFSPQHSIFIPHQYQLHNGAFGFGDAPRYP